MVKYLLVIRQNFDAHALNILKSVPAVNKTSLCIDSKVPHHISLNSSLQVLSWTWVFNICICVERRSPDTAEVIAIFLEETEFSVGN